MKTARDDPPPYSPSPQETAPLLPPPTPHRRQRQPLHPKEKSTLVLVLKFAVWFSACVVLGLGIGRWVSSEDLPETPRVPPIVRVAVVGAGPAGVGAAYTIQNQVKGRDVRVEIVVFEEKGKVGGRVVLGSDDMLGRLGKRVRAEDVACGVLGGTILRERARAALGFDYGRKEGDREVKDVGFFDGKGFTSKVTRPSEKIGWGMWLALIWRYGASVWRTRDLWKGTMSNFEKLLKAGKTFQSVNDMMENAEIEGAVEREANEKLRFYGIGGKYVDEVLAPQSIRQMGQRVDELSDLAISMALDREDQVSGGIGNRFDTVLKEFLKRSRAVVRLNTKVTGLEREQAADGKEAWILELKPPGDHQPTYETFDKVMLASPWNTSSLRVDETNEEDEVYYRSLWVTFFVSTGELKGDFFGGSDKLPSQILPISSANLPSELEGVHEISRLADVFGPDISSESVQKLYRILSEHPISKDTISIFVEGGILESFQEKIESAYPLTWPRKGNFGSFKIQGGLWHTGLIEGIGSSVDLSWVAGENVGKLVAREVGKGKP